MSRAKNHDWLLSQLGITHYRLAHPDVLHGEYAFVLSHEIRLLIISETAPNDEECLFQDILRSLPLNREQIDVVSPEQLSQLTLTDALCLWFIGVDDHNNHPNCPRLYSPELEKLKHDPVSKRQLWQMISRYADTTSQLR